MKTILLRVGALTLVLGLAFTAASRGADDPKAVYAELDKIAADLAAGKDVSEATKALAKKYELNDAMYAFKPKSGKHPGMGIGGATEPDGIEAAWLNFAKKAPSAELLKAKNKELLKGAQITAALAEVAHQYPPKNAAQVADWNKYNAEMKKATKDLTEAIKAEDPMKVRTAANKLNASCNDCHTKFRPN